MIGLVNAGVVRELAADVLYGLGNGSDSWIGRIKGGQMTTAEVGDRRLRGRGDPSMAGWMVWRRN